jgi:hypothetical protein
VRESDTVRSKRKKSLKYVLARAMHCSKRRIFLGDKFLEPITSKAMGEFLVADETDELEWKKNVLECNLFALYLRANCKKWFGRQGLNVAVGTIWVYPTRNKVGHAFNFYVLPSLEVRYIEPQTDAEMFLEGRRVKLVII